MTYYNEYIGVTQDEFVLENQAMVNKVIHKYYVPKLSTIVDSFEDLRQIGNIGLIKAYCQYDPTKSKNKIKPSTYGYSKIVAEISTYLKDRSELIHFPREFYSVWNFYRNSNILDQNDYETIAAEGNFKLALVKRAMPHFESTVLSMNHKVSNGGKEEEFGDAFYRTTDDLTGIIVNDFLDRLNDFDREIIERMLEGKTYIWFKRNRGMTKDKFYRSIHRTKAKLKRYMEVAE